MPNLVFPREFRFSRPKIALATLVLLLGLGLTLAWASSAPIIVSDSATVTMSDSSYSPNKIVVIRGATVMWINRGEKDHWPASNFHPTHGNYPEGEGCIGSKFDACRGLKTGESYSFTFNFEGSWGVHDHLFPGLTMVVEVKSDGETPDFWQTLRTNIQNFWQGLVGKSQGYRVPTRTEFRALDSKPDEQKQIIERVGAHDPKAAWDLVKNAFIVNGQVEANAHSFAHLAGHFIYTKLGLGGIGICDESFAYGCYHGVAEEMLRIQGPQAITSLQNECLKALPPQISDNWSSCIHGLGHGLLTWEGLEVKKALLDCDALDEQYRTYCYDGVFMENSMSALPSSFSQDNPWGLCQSLNEIYHYNCGRYQSVIFRQNFGWGVKKSGEVCALAPSVILKEPCFASLGFFAAQSAAGEISGIERVCNEIASTEGKNYCLIYAATEVRFQRYRGFEETSLEICRNLPTEWQSKCGKVEF